MKIRIRIREQLSFCIALTNVLALTILTVAVWFQTVRYMKDAREETLSVTANLKAAQISQAISLSRDSVRSISTRENLQLFVTEFNNGNRTDELSRSIEVSGTDKCLTFTSGIANTAVEQSQQRIIWWCRRCHLSTSCSVPGGEQFGNCPSDEGLCSRQISSSLYVREWHGSIPRR